MVSNLRILHLPSSFFPDYTGGKEVFVFQLALNLIERGSQSSVLIHSGSGSGCYEYKGVPVHVLPSLVSKDYRKSYFTRIYQNILSFQTFIKQQKPDIIHFHDQGEGASLSHLRICKELGIKTLLTYHSPGQSCMQRALIYADKKPCDGYIDIDRCTSCRYQTKGIPEKSASLMSRVSLPVDSGGKIFFRNSTRLFYNSWKEFYQTVDAIQVHAKWVKELLLSNGVSPEKIHFVDMGGHESLPKKIKDNVGNDLLKIVFIGRCTDIKGIHLLIDAVLEIPKDMKLEVHFFSPAWDDEYGKRLLGRINGDPRFKLPVLIPADQIVARLQKMDVCIIPSLWPETGPFTVFDALAAGIPVVGTNLAGIPERVKHEKNGLLFEWNNADDLKNQILRLYNDSGLLQSLRENIQPNRTFSQMGKDFISLYKQILHPDLTATA